jgi:type I restriction enzyme S subunit
MKQDWEEKTLGDVLDVLRNGANCKQDKKGVGDKISRIESISNADFDINKVGYATLSKSDKDKHRLLKGDILFSHINSPIHVGKTALFNSDEEVYHGVNLLLMRTKSFLNESYFEHYLKFLFKEGYWKGLCKQSVNQASVNQNDIKKVTINFPKSLTQQKQIVATLDKAFAAIDTAKANAEKNLQNAKELFESYLQNVFENKGDDWDEKTLGEIAENLDKQRVPITKKDRKEGNIPYYGASGIVDYVQDYLFDEDLLCISEDGANLLARTYPIAFSIYGKTWVNNHAHVLRFDNISSQYFVEYYLNSIKLDDFISGMAQPKLNQTKLNNIPIPIPNSIEEQKQIVKKLDALSAETKKLESIYTQKLADLEEMKKSILQKAFSGQLSTIN